MGTYSTVAKSKLVKLFLVGDSGSGKTGALTSLVQAGYKLRIINSDNGLDALFNHVLEACPDLIETIQFQHYQDVTKMGPMGPITVGAPTAIRDIYKAIDVWPDDGSTPSEWGEDYVLVLDPLSHMGRAALRWAKAMNPTLKDPRLWYNPAQDVLEELVGHVCSENFKTNVIIISHIEMREQENKSIQDQISAVGKSLGRKLPSYVNTLALTRVVGSGKNARRVITTTPTSTLALKTPAPMRMESEYPLETGLASIFEKLKEL